MKYKIFVSGNCRTGAIIHDAIKYIIKAWGNRPGYILFVT